VVLKAVVLKAVVLKAVVLKAVVLKAENPRALWGARGFFVPAMQAPAGDGKFGFTVSVP
jgi:hypothetical protein